MNTTTTDTSEIKFPPSGWTKVKTVGDNWNIENRIIDPNSPGSHTGKVNILANVSGEEVAELMRSAPAMKTELESLVGITQSLTDALTMAHARLCGISITSSGEPITDTEFYDTILKAMHNARDLSYIS